MCVSVCMHMPAGRHVPWNTYRGQIAHRSWFFPSTIWVLGMELRSLDWAESITNNNNKTHHGAISLASQLEIFAVVDHSKANTEVIREEGVCWSGLAIEG